MKNLKSILGILVILFLMSPFLYSQDIGQGEFMIVNQTGNRIIGIEICPMGAIFSGGGQYTVDARYPIDPQNNIKYIYPTGRINIDYQGYNYTKANFDYTELRGGCAFTLGYGKYQISFFDENGGIFTCYIDFSDANFKGITTSDYYQKLRINIRYNSGYNFSYNFIDLEGNNTSEVPIVLLDVIQVWQQLGTGNDPLTPSKGNFNDTLTYRDFPIVAYEHGAINHFNPQQVFLNFKVKYDGAFLHNDRSLYFNNCNFTVDNADNEITFTINSFAPTLYPIVISGAEGNFIAGGHSTIKFSEGEGIKIENQAKIDLNGAKFNSSSGYWGGINLIDPGPSTINNCEFTNANTAIYSSESFTNLLAISNCTFNNSITGINLNYATNISILSNHFWLPDNPGFRTTGLSVYNGAFSEEDNNLAPWFRINIIGNDFHYGNQHLIVCGISEQLSPVYISKNIFEDGGQNMVLFNTYGSISENNIQNSLSYTNSNNCVNITSSNPDFLNNILNSNNNNFELFSSHPNFAPLRFDNQFFWKAGKNNLTTRSNQFNILIPSENFRGNFYTEYGRNVFNSSNYHLYAYLDVEELYYKSVENCWKNGENQTQPIYDLINTNNEEMVIEYNPTYCNNMEDQIIDRIITDMGNGVFDTVLVTQSSTIPPPSNDESLYGTGVKNKLLKNYSSAIANFKNLINTYPNSKHLGSTVFNLYECYVLSDTNRTQSFRNVIFGDLKNFLEDKIQQYENNDEFVNVAYDFTLKCKVKIKSYSLALDGYEFIAENSPSATERLMASLSYIDVDGLIQGGNGGGVKENKNAFKAIRNISTQENKTPIKDILLKVYSKAKDSKKKKENLDLQKSNDVSKTRAELDKKHNLEKTIENRALNNISISGSLNAEQRRERIRKDLLLLTQRETENNPLKGINSLPINYSLSQNYPNPFNPVTKINYSIAKQGLVTLKIYDILGREVKTLVNEVKSPGAYIVDFNGSSFASGVYFYKIQSGNFMQVKRMVLIK